MFWRLSLAELLESLAADDAVILVVLRGGMSLGCCKVEVLQNGNNVQMCGGTITETSRNEPERWAPKLLR